MDNFTAFESNIFEIFLFREEDEVNHIEVGERRCGTDGCDKSIPVIALRNELQIGAALESNKDR